MITKERSKVPVSGGLDGRKTASSAYSFFLEDSVVIYLKARVTDREMERASIFWLTASLAATAGLGQDKPRQEPGASSRSPTWMEGPQAHGPSSTTSPRPSAGRWNQSRAAET